MALGGELLLELLLNSAFSVRRLAVLLLVMAAVTRLLSQRLLMWLNVLAVLLLMVLLFVSPQSQFIRLTSYLIYGLLWALYLRVMVEPCPE